MVTFFEVEYLFLQEDRRILFNRKKQRRTSSARYVDNYRRRKVHKLFSFSSKYYKRGYRLLGHYATYSKEFVVCFRVCLQMNRLQYFTFSIYQKMFDKMIWKTYKLMDDLDNEQKYCYRYAVIVKFQPVNASCLYFRTLARDFRKKYFCALQMIADDYKEYCLSVIKFVPELKEIAFHISVQEVQHDV